jgi:hypothetical protein
VAYIDRSAAAAEVKPLVTAVSAVKQEIERAPVTTHVVADIPPPTTTATTAATASDKPQLKTLVAALMTAHKEWFSNKFCATFLTPGTNTVCLDKYAATVRIFIDPAWSVHTTHPEYSEYMHTDDKGAAYLEMTLRMGCIGLAAVTATVCGATGFRVERKAPTELKPKPDDNTMLVSATQYCVFGVLFDTMCYVCVFSFETTRVAC